jgi:hypothetical protein
MVGLSCKQWKLKSENSILRLTSVSSDDRKPSLEVSHKVIFDGVMSRVHLRLDGGQQSFALRGGAHANTIFYQLQLHRWPIPIVESPISVAKSLEFLSRTT